MAKGQKHSNKEIRKPKSTVPKKAAEATTASVFAKPTKAFTPPKKK
jgi:hypothetical protein